MIYGLDYLGGARFGDLLAREHPEGWAAGFFANTFGNAWPVIERLLATGRCPSVRVHAIWEDNHTYDPRRHDPIIKREAAKAADLARRFPKVAVNFSPFCEHSIKGAALTRLFENARAWAPGCILVNSIWTGDETPLAHFQEVHGTHKKPKRPYLYSFDGNTAVDSDVESLKALHSTAATFFYWHQSFNGKYKVKLTGGETPEVKRNDSGPRPQRKAWPTSELIDSLIYLHRPAGQVRLPRNYLWKTHADRHNTPPEPRAYKPVLICPPKADRAELVADNGQVVAVSNKRESFADGRFRYYFSEYGYQLAEKAVRIHGKPTVSLRVNGKVVGVVNPAFRAGSFRD